MSDASVGSIIGYLRLDRSDWDAELNAAGRKADELARHNPNVKISTNAPSAIAQLATVAAAVRRLQDAQGAENVAQAKLTELQNRGNASASQLRAAEERLQRAHRATAAATIGLAAAHDKNSTAMRRAAAEADQMAASSRKSSFQMHALRDAILLIGPAAVPVAAVAAGAILGLVPVAAAAILGIRGISQEYKSGALAGTQYGADIKSLVDEFTNLKQTAASGLLGGVDQAIQSSQPLFGALNQDIGTLSSQLGSIVAGAAPALLTILNALNPLFVTFGNLLSDGAAKLEHWATSSGGIQSFVAYIQAELPTVVHALGQLVQTGAHVLEAFAPAGNAILTILGALASAINSIPVGVLQGLVPVALALYAAFRGYGAITAVVNGVSAAVNAMKAPFVTTAAQAEASSLAIQAAAAQEAAAVAESNAAMAAAAAESAVEIAAAVEGTSSVLAAGAAAAAEAAIQESAAFQATAQAAIASATEITASATAAAETVAAEGKVAAAGWAGMLGPIGAVVIGVGILAATFLTSRKDAQEAAAAADSYAQSVKSSTDALSLANVQQTNANLAKKGALDILAKLSAANKNLGVSQIDLTTAVNGTKEQFDSLTQKIVQNSLGSAKQEIAASKLVDILKVQRKGLQDQILTQTQLNSINAASAGISDSQAVAAAKLYGLVGTDGVAAYLAAKQSAQQNTDATRNQTLAFQMENDAGSLLQQTLDKLAGKQLSYAQSQNSFDSALSNMGDHISAQGKKITFTTTSIKNMSAASVELRGQLLNQVSVAEQTAEAYGKMKGSSEAGRQELIKLRKQIIDNAVAHGVDRKAVTDYINTVLKIPKKVPPTKLQIDASSALRTIRELTHQRYTINVQAVASGGIANLGNGIKAKAAGGTVGGGGGPTADDQLTWLSSGEEVINAKQANKHRALLKAINAGADGFTFGGTVGGIAPMFAMRPQPMQLAAPAASSAGSTSVARPSEGLQLVQHIYPQPEQSPMAIAKASSAEMLWALRR